MELGRISITELVEAAKATHSYFFEHPLIAGMTLEQATWIREKRGSGDYSWRGIADLCADDWGGDWGDNQIAGIAICEKAASFFGEDAWKGSPWN